MRVVTATESHKTAWLSLRAALWPGCPTGIHVAEIERILRRTDREGALLGFDDGDKPVGFVEVSLRDYANGCHTSPVAFVEGVFVVPGARHLGVGRELIRAAEQWARAKGCTELGSDADLSNEDSHEFHRKLGFTESEKVVYFRKDLTA